MGNCIVDRKASDEIFAIAQAYGLVDAYADAPGSRIGEYVGTVNGKSVSCVVYDRDPAADMRALRLAASLPAGDAGTLSRDNLPTIGE